MFGIFKKGGPDPDPTEVGNDVSTDQQASDASPEDYERATLIQQKAQVGMWIAKRFGDPDEDQVDTFSKYKRLRDELLGVLDKIEDDFVRGFATHILIKMAVAADDYSVARALWVGVRLDFIRDQIRADFNPGT